MDNMDKKHPVSELMRSTIEKIHELVDTNVIVGQPITTPDGVTLIPISRVNFGFGSGGGDYGKAQPHQFGGGGAAGVKIDPVAFLVIKDGGVKLVNIKNQDAVTKVLDMVPDLIEKFTKPKDKAESPEKEEEISDADVVDIAFPEEEASK